MEKSTLEKLLGATDEEEIRKLKKRRLIYLIVGLIFWCVGFGLLVWRTDWIVATALFFCFAAFRLEERYTEERYR